MQQLKFVLLSVMVLLATISKAQTADEIVEKYVTAIGGRDNWSKVQSMIMSGTLSAGGQVAEFKTSVIDGKAFRQDFTLAGVTGYKIVTPTAGWVYMPGAGDQQTKQLSKQELAEAQGLLNVKSNLIDYKNRGARVELQGKESTEGQECYKLKLIEKNGTEQWLFISTGTYYLVSSLSHVKVMSKDMDIATIYNDYQKQPGGIVVASSITVQGGTIRYSQIDINKQIDENIFKPNGK